MISRSLDEIALAHHDVCIVGSGPIGLSLALELERFGKRALVLESGIETATDAAQDLSAADIVRPDLHDDMRIAVSRQLGGTSNLWGGRCQPLDAIDFMDRPYVAHGRWPVTREELWPYYERACSYLSCGGQVFLRPPDGFQTNDEDFVWSALERFSNTPSFRRRYHKVLRRSSHIDIRLDATVVDLILQDGAIAAVTVAGSNGERRHIPVARVVIAAGGLESTRLLLRLQRKQPDLFGGPDGPLGRYYMGHLIGEIADIVFADERGAKAFDFFVDGHRSYARRRFVPSERLQQAEKLLNVAFWPVVPPISDARHRSGILSLIYLALASGPLREGLLPEAILKRHLQSDVEIAGHVWNILKDLLPILSFAPPFLWKRYASAVRLPGLFILNKSHRYGLSYHAEHSPNPDSRVRLGPRTDALGLPRLEIDIRFAEADVESVVKAHRLLGQWLQRTGLGSLEYHQREEDSAAAVRARASHGTHQIGTIRMGSTRRLGVVTRDLDTFDIPNLFVASTAVMPTSGQANPTMTGTALGVRLAEHLATRICP